ncbi:MAG: tetratricopeptide repeat protein [Ectothiorhodospiraceae bacterium]|nr:tetratricopeptide repeat protein [Ectothiorhodospiraceae bacterium]
MSTPSSGATGGDQPELERVFAEIRALRAAKRLHKAHRRACSLLATHPDSTEIRWLVATLEIERGQPAAAVEHLRRITTSAPDNPAAHATLGDALLGAGRPLEAADAYRHALALRADLSPVRARLALALQEGGELEAAITEYRAAAEALPRDPTVRYNLGTALKRLHRFDDALTAYRAALALAPRDRQLLLRIAVLLVETDHLDEAVTHLETLCAAGSPPAAVWDLLTYAHKKLRHGPQAVQAAERLTELTNGSVPSLQHLSAARLCAGDPAGALEACERGLARVPASRQLLSDKAIALAGLGRRDEAARVVDLDRDLFTMPIEAPPGYASVAEFNADLVRHIDGHPRLRFDGISLSCHQGATSDELLVEPKGPVAALESALEQAARRYRAQLPPGAEHPWIAHLPAELELSAWVTMLRDQGYQHGHIHPTAWISGVYYVRLPEAVRDGSDDEHAGWIEFGRSPPFYAVPDQGRILPLRPSEGLIVLFPPFFYHRTIPFRSDERRITIAFDFREPRP